MSGGDAFGPVDHVSEREPGPWQDCTFASMLEVLRDGFPDGRLIPPTDAEREAYRAAAGLPDDHGGANLAEAIDGAEVRYGLGGGYVTTTSWSVLKAALSDPDARCAVQGLMGAVPSYLRRFDPTFLGAHSVAARGAVWCDPLAPKGLYCGELVPLATWEQYFKGLPGARAFITNVGGLTRMAGDYVIYETRKSGQPKAGASFFNDWELVSRRGGLGTNPSRVEVRGYRGDAHAIRVRTAQGWPDGVARITNVFIAKGDVSDVKDDPLPDTTPYSQADLDAAYERGKAEGDVKHTVTLSIDGAPASTTEV